jgi:hypothetical protein
MFGVGVELHPQGGIEIVDGGDQADYAGGNQVFQADVIGHAVVNSPGNQTNLWEMLEDERFALRGDSLVASGTIVLEAGGHRIS